MTSEQHFKFFGLDSDHEYLTGFRVDLGGPPCVHRIQHLFEDLYTQCRLNPQYLFVSSKDRTALESQIAAWSSYCGPVAIPRINMVSKICNEVTGKLVDLVTLSGLERGTVILGFFR